MLPWLMLSLYSAERRIASFPGSSGGENITNFITWPGNEAKRRTVLLFYCIYHPGHVFVPYLR